MMGVLCSGSCPIKHLSSIQAEICAATFAISEAKGLKYLGRGFGKSFAAWCGCRSMLRVALVVEAVLGKLGISRRLRFR